MEQSERMKRFSWGKEKSGGRGYEGDIGYKVEKRKKTGRQMLLE